MKTLLVLYTINGEKKSSHICVDDNFKINPFDVRKKIHERLDQDGYTDRKLMLQAVLPAETQVIIPDEWRVQQ